jgi:hypothetical protein
MRQQNETDDDAPDEISEDNLQKCQIRVVGEAGNADDGERAGFGGDNRKGNRPPGNVAVSQEVIAQCALTLAETQAEQSDPHEIERNNREIEFV